MSASKKKDGKEQVIPCPTCRVFWEWEEGETRICPRCRRRPAHLWKQFQSREPGERQDTEQEVATITSLSEISAEQEVQAVGREGEAEHDKSTHEEVGQVPHIPLPPMYFDDPPARRVGKAYDEALTTIPINFALDRDEDLSEQSQEPPRSRVRLLVWVFVLGSLFLALGAYLSWG